MARDQEADQAFDRRAQDGAALAHEGLGFGIRVEIVPLSPGLRYWALLTSTDNETQHIFAPLPQP